MEFNSRITMQPSKRDGKPCIRNTRITVYDVLDWMASGRTRKAILEEYPELTIEDIQACLEFVAKRERPFRSLSSL